MVAKLYDINKKALKEVYHLIGHFLLSNVLPVN